MADEIPPAPSESTDDLTKSETIRITLPPKSDQPAVKRETVRINVPGKPSPKKETTKLTTAPAAPAAPGAAGAPPTAPKPFIPPPPAPKTLPTVPAPLAKPLPGATPPKPPTLGARPTVPLKPAPAPSAGPTPVPGDLMAQKSAASPKKETARITLPPEAAKSTLPKATVKMQQTQPLAPRPSAIQQAPVVAQAPSAAFSTGQAADPLVGPLSVGAAIAVVVAFIMVLLAMNATALP
jgi:hypothetical protein